MPDYNGEFKGSTKQALLDVKVDISEIKKSIKTLNDHSSATIVRLTRIEDKVDHVVRIVSGLVGLVLIVVATAVLALILN